MSETKNTILSSDAYLKGAVLGFAQCILPIPAYYMIFIRNFAHFKMQALQRQRAAVISPEQKKTVQENLHLLQECISQNEAPYYTRHELHEEYPLVQRVDNPAEALFHPKKVHKLDMKRYHFTDMREEKIRKQINSYLEMTPKQRIAYMDKYFVVKVITEEDCLKQDECPRVLIGQKGVFAVKNLPVDTLLGVYAGIYARTQEEMKEIYRKYGAYNVTPYVFGFNEQKLPRVSSFGVGNRMTIINDATDYSGTDEENHALLIKRQNVRALYAKSTNNPDREFNRDPKKHDLVLYATLRPVREGEQLYITYGKSYWNSLHRTKEFINNHPVVRNINYQKGIDFIEQKLHETSSAHNGSCQAGCGHTHGHKPAEDSITIKPAIIPAPAEQRQELRNRKDETEIFDCGL